MAKVLTAPFTERYYFEPIVYVCGKYAADVNLGMVMGAINAIRKMNPNRTIGELTIKYEKRKVGLEMQYSVFDDNSHRAYLPYYHLRNDLIIVKYQHNQTRYYLNRNGSQATEERVSALEDREDEAHKAYFNSIKEATNNSGTYRSSIWIEWRKSKKAHHAGDNNP